MEIDFKILIKLNRFLKMDFFYKLDMTKFNNN